MTTLFRRWGCVSHESNNTVQWVAINEMLNLSYFIIIIIIGLTFQNVASVHSISSINYKTTHACTKVWQIYFIVIWICMITSTHGKFSNARILRNSFGNALFFVHYENLLTKLLINQYSIVVVLHVTLTRIFINIQLYFIK